MEKYVSGSKRIFNRRLQNQFLGKNYGIQNLICQIESGCNIIPIQQYEYFFRHYLLYYCFVFVQTFYRFILYYLLIIEGKACKPALQSKNVHKPVFMKNNAVAVIKRR
jgi:hypothetical protein